MRSMADKIDRQLDRLEVRHGDILVLRTSQKLQPTTAARWQDDLIRMCGDAGVTDVGTEPASRPGAARGTRRAGAQNGAPEGGSDNDGPGQ